MSVEMLMIYYKFLIRGIVVGVDFERILKKSKKHQKFFYSYFFNYIAERAEISNDIPAKSRILDRIVEN